MRHSRESPAPLLAEIGRLAAGSGGAVGLGALHLQSGRLVNYSADESFPLASTVKVAILVALCQQVDSGRLDLATFVEVRPADFVPSGTLAEKFPHAGVALSLANLAHLMIIDSDNTATDVVLRTIGGMEAVRGALERRGIAGINPCRTIAELYGDLWDIPQLDDPDASVLARMQADPAFYKHWQETWPYADPAYTADLRDQGTPTAMVELLRQLWVGEGLSRKGRDFALETMRHTATGPDRIKGRLPQGMEVAHKTGSAPGTTNDVGYVALPGALGTVALAIYVKNSKEPQKAVRAIADLARLVGDYFVLHESA